MEEKKESPEMPEAAPADSETLSLDTKERRTVRHRLRTVCGNAAGGRLAHPVGARQGGI